MVVHPAPPADVPAIAEAYQQVVGAFVGTCDGLREAEWDLPTATPGWTVKDHVAHVLHIEDHLTGSEHPLTGWTGVSDIAVGSPEHVRNDFGVWIEEGVRARTEVPGPDLVSELRAVAEIRTAQLYGPELDLDSTVRSVMGEDGPLGKLMRLRLTDIWVHGQDIRAALGRPGDLDSPGAAVFTAIVLDAVPRIVLRRVRPEPGTVVIVESTGPVTGRSGVRIGTDADGQPVAHELFTGHAEEREDDGAGEAGTATEDSVTTISLSTHELTRRAAGRTTTADTAYHVIGDEDLARRVLDAVVITP